jgi:transcriptional regulator with XRE-family HTH domain
MSIIILHLLFRLVLLHGILASEVVEMTIGENIKKCRKTLKLTQEDLAKKSSISVMSIRRYEADERNPDIQTLQRIAVALGKPISKLIEIEIEQKQDAFMEYIKAFSYNVDGDPAEGYLWMEHAGCLYEINDNDLDGLTKSVNAFIEFTLREFISDKKIIGSER